MAEALYVNTNKTQQEIAITVGVSEKTITKWKNDDKWDDKKAAISISKDHELRRLFTQLNELNTAIESKPAGQRYPSSKEADALKKLTAAIKDLETDLGISDTINVCMKMLKWMRSIDMEASIRFSELSDKYIKTLIK